MSRFGLLRRQLFVVGSAATIGLIAGLLVSSAGGAIATAVVLVICVPVLAYWAVLPIREGLESLRGFVASWRESLDVSSPGFDRTNEISLLRDEMEGTRKYLFKQRISLQEQGASLRRDTTLLQTVLGAMVEGVVVVDDRSQLLYVNPAARRMLEFHRRDLEGRLLHELTRSAKLLETVRRVLETRAEQNVEFVMPREHRTLTVAASPIVLEPTSGVVLVLYDVTELRKLEQMRRDFVSNVSHELKTPLTAIQAYADSLLEGAVDDPEINRRFVERIIEQAERLRKLILDLIGLARVESQQETLELAPLEVRTILRSCVESHAAVAASKSVQLEVDESSMSEPSTSGTIPGNRDALHTILDNLIRNAIHYTPEGGRVTVRAVPINSSGKQEVALEVEDTGIGIARDMQPRVFERFFRVDKARSRDAGGTGLGLSIVKHLTQQLNGRIELESELDRGSRFRVIFPVFEPGEVKHPMQH